MGFDVVQKVAIWLLPVLFAITLHEVAHGWVAARLGDPTARDAGRLTLNPLRHVDLVGTVLVPALTLTLGGILFGWAKPVPISWHRLGRPRRDIALVALAGPLSNIVQALAWAIIAKAAIVFQGVLGSLALPLVLMGMAGILVNAVLAALNLVPLPPLDGGRVLVSVLPPAAGRAVARLEPLGLPILLVLILTGMLFRVIGPVILALSAVMAGLAGISLQEFELIIHKLT